MGKKVARRKPKKRKRYPQKKREPEEEKTCRPYKATKKRNKERPKGAPNSTKEAEIRSCHAKEGRVNDVGRPQVKKRRSHVSAKKKKRKKT